MRKHVTISLPAEICESRYYRGGRGRGAWARFAICAGIWSYIGLLCIYGAESYFDEKMTNLTGWTLATHQNGRTMTAKRMHQIGIEQKTWKGEECAKLRYKFSTKGEDAVLISKDVKINRGDMLMLKIWGDESGHQLFCVLKDVGGEKHFISLPPLIWSGWREVGSLLTALRNKPPLEMILPEHFGGDKNQILDYPIKKITIGVSDQHDKYVGEGKFYLAQIAVGDRLKTEALDAIKKKIKVSPAEGKSGKGYLFNGADSYLEFDGRYIAQNLENAITVEAWIKPIGPSNLRVPEGWGHHGGIVALSNREMLHGVFELSFDNARQFNWRVVGKKWYTMKSPAKYDYGKWYHIVATYDGKMGKIYIDGHEVVARELGVMLPFSHLTGMIGQVWKESYENRGFNGIIDEVKIYNRPLNSDEVRLKYEKGGNKEAGEGDDHLAYWSFD